MTADIAEIRKKLAHAGIALEAGSWADALELLEPLAEEHPELPDIRNRVAVCLAMLGRSEEAVEHLDAALEVNPAYAEAHLNRAIILHELGRHEEAGAAAEEADRLDRRDSEAYPSDLGNKVATAHARLAELYMVAGEAAKAAEHYQAALEVRPRFLDIRRGYADALMACDRLDEAREILEAVLEERPGLTDARVRLGVTLRRLGDLDGAAEAWERCLEQDPGDLRARAYLAALTDDDPDRG